MGETKDYTPPEHVIKPAADDTGYAIVKKAYRRFIWTWNDYVNKKPKKK